MINKSLVLFLSLFYCSLYTVIGQKLTDKIDTKNFQKTFFEKEFVKKINHIRDSLQQKPIILNEKLNTSANFHSKYLSKNEKISHYQKKSKYKDAHARATSFGLQKKFVWENMMSCKILKPTYISYQKGNKKTTINTYQDLLNFIINGFFASEANMKNFVSEKVKETGIGIVLNNKKQHIYFVQVYSD